MAYWIKNQDSTICCLQAIHHWAKDTVKLKVRGWKKLFHVNGKHRKSGVAILMSDKTGFKIKSVKKDKERHYLIIKGSIQEEDITIINICAPHTEAPKHIKHILKYRKGEIDGNRVIVGDFNTPLTSMDRSSRHKINKAMEILNDRVEMIDLIDIFRTLHPKNQNIHSSAHGTVSRIEHILGHKTNFKKLSI